MIRTPRLTLTVQFALCDNAARQALKALLSRATLNRWVKAALIDADCSGATLTLRFVDTVESQMLNRTYRGKDNATNVLTFAYSDIGDPAIVGDLALCPTVIEREADEQEKTLDAHYAHLIVHGVLHAQGYRHDDDVQAHIMESLEIRRLAALGFADPYQSNSIGHSLV